MPKIAKELTAIEVKRLAHPGRGDDHMTAVEVRRITVASAHIASDSFPLAVQLEGAERRCRRALVEVWAGRKSASFRLPPSQLGFDPCYAIVCDRAA